MRNPSYRKKTVSFKTSAWMLTNKRLRNYSRPEKILKCPKMVSHNGLFDNFTLNKMPPISYSLFFLLILRILY